MIDAYSSPTTPNISEQPKLRILSDEPGNRLHSDIIVEEILSRTKFPNPDWTTTEIKLFVPSAHGAQESSTIYEIPPYRSHGLIVEFLYCERQFRRDHPDAFNIDVGVCSTFKDHVSGQTWQLPMIDLEIDSTHDTESDLNRIVEKLLVLGLTGSFVRSGDVGAGKGSYHFIADRLYEIELHTLVGIFLSSLADEGTENGELAIGIGRLLLDATTQEEITRLGKKILEIFPSQPSGLRREGLLFDPRHLAHALVDNGTIVLRATKKYGYRVSPVLVAELY